VCVSVCVCVCVRVYVYMCEGGWGYPCGGQRNAIHVGRQEGLQLRIEVTELPWQ
jgi:hypothetical protein